MSKLHALLSSAGLLCALCVTEQIASAQVNLSRSPGETSLDEAGVVWHGLRLRVVSSYGCPEEAMDPSDCTSGTARLLAGSGSDESELASWDDDDGAIDVRATGSDSLIVVAMEQAFDRVHAFRVIREGNALVIDRQWSENIGDPGAWTPLPGWAQEPGPAQAIRAVERRFRRALASGNVERARNTLDQLRDLHAPGLEEHEEAFRELRESRAPIDARAVERHLQSRDFERHFCCDEHGDGGVGKGLDRARS